MTAHVPGRFRRIAVWCAVIFLLGVGSRPAGAQSLLPVQGLTFGVLEPGAPLSISPEESGRGIIDVVGSGSLSILFVPPPAMISAQGHSIPLEFNPGDVVLQWRNANTFPLTIGGLTALNIPTGQAPAVIYIGGTARAAAGQAPGLYTATLVVQIVPSGI